MQTLPHLETKQFYDILNPLTHYVHRCFPLPGVTIEKPTDVFNIGVENITTLQKKLWGNPELITDFIRDDPFALGNDALATIHSWKDRLTGDFVIMRHHKDYTVLLHEKDNDQCVLYGIKSLFDPLENMFDLYTRVTMTLVPFRGQITYTGVAHYSNIIFGRGICGEWNELMRDAKLRYGIVTSLPFNPERDGKSDAERLRSYCSTWKKQEAYAREIAELRTKSTALRLLWEIETNKLHARDLSKNYRTMGLTGLHIALCKGLPVAVGKDKASVERQLKQTVPSDQKPSTYIFHI